MPACLGVSLRPLPWGSPSELSLVTLLRLLRQGEYHVLNASIGVMSYMFGNRYPVFWFTFFFFLGWTLCILGRQVNARMTCRFRIEKPAIGISSHTHSPNSALCLRCLCYFGCQITPLSSASCVPHLMNSLVTLCDCNDQPVTCQYQHHASFPAFTANEQCKQIPEEPGHVPPLLTYLGMYLCTQVKHAGYLPTRYWQCTA